MRKGQKMSKLSREKIRIKLLGRRCSPNSEFTRGIIPWNKGTKGLTKANKASFKKGNTPKNYKGGIKSNGKDGVYILVKKNYYKCNSKKQKHSKYEQLARIIWRKHYGDFDKKFIVFHKDKDINNNDINNLELITRAELLKRNNSQMKQGKCIICTKSFLANRNKKTCSEECNRKNNNILVKINSEVKKNYM